MSRLVSIPVGLSLTLTLCFVHEASQILLCAFMSTPEFLGAAARCVLPLGRCVGVQNPCALHPGTDRGHAGGERLLLHGQGPPGEAVLDGEHQNVLLGAFSSPETRQKMKSNPPCTKRSKKPKDHLD